VASYEGDDSRIQQVLKGGEACDLIEVREIHIAKFVQFSVEDRGISVGEVRQHAPCVFAWMASMASR
jgi:hypothetical protein